MEYITVREACSRRYLNRSANWIRAAIKLGKIRAEKAGNVLLISRGEIDRAKANMPNLSAKETRRV